jgi:hypothetical protein
MKRLIWTIAGSIAIGSMVMAENLPKGFYISDNTLSPDHKYGVTVFNNTDNGDVEPPDGAKSQVIEVKTGHVLGAIQADLAMKNMNHDEIVPTRWTADDSMMLWQVDGKWGFSDIVLIKLADGKIQSQIDLLDLLQKEILKRTQKAKPKDYAAVKATSADFGSWYKDGFAIDCVLDEKGDGTDGPMKFPLVYQVFLTSNTKGMEDIVNVDSRMTASIAADGTLHVDDFHIGRTPPARTW